MNWFDIFNTRETALFVWSALFLAVLLWKAGTRRALTSLLMTLARAKALHQYWAITLLWITCEVLVLQWAGLWSLDHLKATIFWALAVPMTATWRIHQLSQKEKYFVAALRDTFALTVLVEFLVDFYPFPLWAELLIVPLAFGVTLLFEFGKTMDGVEPATKLFGWLLAAFGTFLLGHAALSAFADAQALFSLETLSDLVGPILLTVLFLPYLYGVAVFITYANAFRCLQFQIKDESLRRYAHSHAILHFNFRLELLRRWSRNISSRSTASKQDIRRSMLVVFEARRRERDPAPVDPAHGWSPNIARHFLDEYGLPTQDYRCAAETTDQWWAGSDYLVLDDEILSNNIAYYLDGDAKVARQLKLELNVNNSVSSEPAISTLLELSDVLAQQAIGQPLSPAIREAISSKSDQCVTLEGKQVIVEFDQFVNDRGFTIRLVMRQPGWKNASTGSLRIDREQDRARTVQTEPG
jgi:hypothetical protein